MPRTKKQSGEAAVRDIRRKTRRRFSVEEKIRIVLDGMRGELSVKASLVRDPKSWSSVKPTPSSCSASSLYV